MTSQRYAIIGTGALGGLYGGLLARGGHEVHFLLHRDYDYVCQHGLKIESPLGDFHLEDVNAHDSASTMPPCDVTVVALKTTQNHLLQEILPAPTRGGGVVLVLQNGLDVESDAGKVVGFDRVLGGCCFLCSNKLGPGHIRHLDYGAILFGEYLKDHGGSVSTPVTERVARIQSELVSAGIDAKATDDLPSARWKKLMWNIPFNGLSVVLDASTKELVDDGASVSMVNTLMNEVYQTAIRVGANLTEDMIDKTIEMTRKMVPYDASMLLDYRHRRSMEIEAIFGNPLRAADSVGVSMPTVRMLYRQLKFLDHKNMTKAERRVD